MFRAKSYAADVVNKGEVSKGKGKRSQYGLKRAGLVVNLFFAFVFALNEFGLLDAHGEVLHVEASNLFAGAVDDKNFTIVVSTFRRDACLKQVMVHWLSCGVRQVRIVWNDVERPIPDFVFEQVRGAQGTLVVDQPPENRISNRFLPRNFPTDAIFSVDDDMMYPCDVVTSAYTEWKKNPRNLVGFAPRHIRQSTPYNWDSSYGWIGFNVANTIFVTKGGFSHQRMFSAFFDPSFEDLRQRVDANITAEDILFSFVHAATAENDEDREPIVVLITKFFKNSTACHDDAGKKSLSSDQKATPNRLSLQLYAESRFGFPFRTVHFRQWRFIDAPSKISSVQTACGGYYGGLNVYWWTCVLGLRHHHSQ